MIGFIPVDLTCYYRLILGQGVSLYKPFGSEPTLSPARLYILSATPASSKQGVVYGPGWLERGSQDGRPNIGKSKHHYWQCCRGPARQHTPTHSSEVLQLRGQLGSLYKLDPNPTEKMKIIFVFHKIHPFPSGKIRHGRWM